MSSASSVHSSAGALSIVDAPTLARAGGAFTARQTKQDHAIAAYRFLDLFSPVPILGKLSGAGLLEGEASEQLELFNMFAAYWSDPTTQHSLVEAVCSACTPQGLAHILRFFGAPEHHLIIERAPDIACRALVAGASTDPVRHHRAAAALFEAFVPRADEKAAGPCSAAIIAALSDIVGHTALVAAASFVTTTVAGQELRAIATSIADWFIDQLMSGFRRTLKANFVNR